MTQVLTFSIHIRKKSGSNLSMDTDYPEEYITTDHDHFQNLCNFFPFTNYPTIRHYRAFKAVKGPLNKSYVNWLTVAPQTLVPQTLVPLLPSRALHIIFLTSHLKPNNIYKSYVAVK